MSKDIAKLYAAFRSGCIENNIIDVYFPFIVKIILDENISEIDSELISKKFKEKYNFGLPIHIIRQTIGVGIQNGSIKENHGRYCVELRKLKCFVQDNKGFEHNWESLLKEFYCFCENNKIDILETDIENSILDIIDSHDEKIVTNDTSFTEVRSDTVSYAWFSFLKHIASSNEYLFDFVAGLSFGNIMKQAIFFSEIDGRYTFNGLAVYLDSPMIFSLLGIDTQARVESINLLVREMLAAGCNVYVFDNNIEEVKGILISAGGWANSTSYDMKKANNAARFFHDSMMSNHDISEFCESVEDKLNLLGVNVYNTTYDTNDTRFNESEVTLFNMIEEKYRESGNEINEEKKISIRTDVRSIMMVYNERKGSVSTRVQNSKHIMLTLNNAIANVSKNYESNKSINSGHIPACMSADLFGSILWLFTPHKLVEYQRKQLLSDCYLSLKPSKELLEKYIDSLDRAKNAEEIDEKKFLFLRTSALVSESLMNVTKGDYARFTERTYLEVYNDIVEKAEKKYRDEAGEHAKTKKAIDDLLIEQEKKEIYYNSSISQISDELFQLKQSLKEIDEKKFKTKCVRLGRTIAACLFGVPYIIALAVIEFLKSHLNEFTNYSVIYMCSLLLISFFVAFLFKKGVAWSHGIAKRLLTKKSAPLLEIN